jgi:hypothetical protein
MSDNLKEEIKIFIPTTGDITEEDPDRFFYQQFIIDMFF